MSFAKFFLPTARVLAYLCVVILLAERPACADTTTPNAQTADGHFQAGVAAMRTNTPEGFAEAYREFRAAYAVNPDRKTLTNIGMAAAALEKDGEAIDALVASLDQGGKDLSPSMKNALDENVKRLERGSATVSLRAPGAFWIVDTRIAEGNSVVNEYGPFSDSAELRVRAGRHDFKLARASITAADWSVTLDAANVAEHTFVARDTQLLTDFTADATAAAPPLPLPLPLPLAEADRAPRSHLPSYILWGSGAVASVTAGVFLLEANRHQDAANEVFETDCPNGISDPPTPGCQRGIEGDARAKKWRTASLLTGIGAVGALAAGTILYLLEPDDAPEDTASGVRPWIVGTTAGITGHF